MTQVSQLIVQTFKYFCSISEIKIKMGREQDAQKNFLFWSRTLLDTTQMPGEARKRGVRKWLILFGTATALGFSPCVKGLEVNFIRPEILPPRVHFRKMRSRVFPLSPTAVVPFLRAQE